MRGKSQHVNTRRGVERGSVPMYQLEVAQLVSESHLSHVRLRRAMKRACAVVVVHSHLGEVIQIVGKSIIVGIKIFSIVGG